MSLRRIADVDVTVPVRFGHEASVEHRLRLRFGPLEWDGSVRGHVLAEASGALVGGVGALLLGVLVYYWLWSLAFTWAVCWVILPGLVAAGVTLAVREARLNRLYTELLRAGHASLSAASGPW